MLEFCPDKVQSAIRHLNYNLLYELRLRKNAPVVVCYAGKYAFLGENGCVSGEKNAITVTAQELENTLFVASEYSVYSVSEEMKELFVTTKEGIRIGIAGTVIYEKGRIQALREFNGLCIRIPHPIKGCADRIFRLCEQDRLRSCILLSKPGIGKTTVLRELIGQIRLHYPLKNILLADERGEIALHEQTGIDILRFCRKEESFSYGIRSLRPDILVTDELQPQDYAVIERSMECGLKVLATAHFDGDITEFRHNFFERHVLLGDCIGSEAQIYDENKEKLP